MAVGLGNEERDYVHEVFCARSGENFRGYCVRVPFLGQERNEFPDAVVAVVLVLEWTWILLHVRGFTEYT